METGLCPKVHALRPRKGKHATPQDNPRDETRPFCPELPTLRFHMVPEAPSPWATQAPAVPADHGTLITLIRGARHA
jgi:hypothetical protein